MFKVRDPRFWTALIVIGAAAFALARGIDLVRFALADMSAYDAADQATIAARLAPWLEAPGVASLARRHVLLQAPRDDVQAPRAEVEARLAATADLLARAPLDANAWADLAALRLASGASVEEASSALAMSNLTGPNEGWIMARRAVLALPLWKVLSPDSRRAAVTDLVGGWSQVYATDRETLRAALSQPGKAAPEELRAALLLAGKEAAPIAQALGLGAPAPPRSNAAPAPAEGSGGPAQADRSAEDAAASDADAKPTTDMPAIGQPSPVQPSTGKPSTGKPSTGKPSTGKPSTGKPSTGKPASHETSSGNPSLGVP